MDELEILKVNYKFPPKFVHTVNDSSVLTNNRKLKAVWSMEAAQDISFTHNITAETNLCDMMTKEVMVEMDREIISDLRNNNFPNTPTSTGTWHTNSWGSGYFYCPYVPLS